MKDSDWIYDFGIEGKDIYSESDSYLNNSYLLTLEITNNLKNNENFQYLPKIQQISLMVISLLL